MKREEVGLALLIAFVAGAFVAILATGLADTLGALGWFSNGANVIQWISGPATFGAVATVVYQYFVRRCSMPLCVRRGEHPVAGTLRKVCRHHHTLEHHELVHDLYSEAHRVAGRLGWGESHDLG